MNSAKIFWPYLNFQLVLWPNISLHTFLNQFNAETVALPLPHDTYVAASGAAPSSLPVETRLLLPWSPPRKHQSSVMVSWILLGAATSHGQFVTAPHMLLRCHLHLLRCLQFNARRLALYQFPPLELPLLPSSELPTCSTLVLYLSSSCPPPILTVWRNPIQI
jgi:hypothetical protein